MRRGRQLVCIARRSAISAWCKSKRAEMKRRESFFSFRGRMGLSTKLSLLHAVVRKILNDLRVDSRCRRDVGIATGYVTLLQLGKSASSGDVRSTPLHSSIFFNIGRCAPATPRVTAGSASTPCRGQRRVGRGFSATSGSVRGFFIFTGPGLARFLRGPFFSSAAILGGPKT